MLTQSVTAGQSKLRVETFDCECHSFDHSIRFAFDPTEDDIRFIEVWVDAHFPNNRSLWQRIVLATKYVLKIGTMDWTYGSWILKHQDEVRLKSFFREYEMLVWQTQARAATKKEGDNVSAKDDSV